MNTRTLIQISLPLLVLLLVALLSEGIASLKQTPEPTPVVREIPVVRVVEAHSEDVPSRVKTHGTVAPRTETHLMSEVSGRVEFVSPALASGGTFEAGEVLIRIDDTDYRAAAEMARAELARTDSMLLQEEADAEIARLDWQQHAGDEEPSPLVLRVPQLAEARARKAAAEAQLEIALRDLERTEVRSPYAGRVRGRAIDLGQFVMKGSELAVVYAVDHAEVRLPIEDEDLKMLDIELAGPTASRPGPYVRFSTRFAGEDQAWSGRIERMEGAIDPETRQVVLVARVEDPYGVAKEGTGAPLLSGLFVDAEIEGRTWTGAIPLPREALRSESRVFVLDDADRLAMRGVDIVVSDEHRVVVTSGLDPGERVIVSPLALPVEGMQLRLEETAE